MLTSDDTMIGRDNWAAYGLSGVVTKPIRASRLFDVIMDVLNVRPANAGAPASAPMAACVAPTGIERILICEDNEVNQFVTSEILAQAGYTFDIASNGMEAITAIAKCDYSLVLMDCQMPVMDGLEATRKIRELEGCGQLSLRNGQALPIVALTANAMKGDREVCTDAGMNGYVAKPIDRSELLSTVARFLNPMCAPISDASPALAAELSSTAVRTISSFEMDELLTRCGGDKVFTQKLLTKFASRLSQEKTKLVDSVTRRAVDEAAKVAHTLKGTAGNVSAMALQKLACELEESIKAESWDCVTPKLDELDMEVIRCLAEIDVMVQEAMPRSTDDSQKRKPINSGM